MSMIGQLGQAVKRLGEAIWGGIKNFFGIHSPSKLTTEGGQFIGRGLLDGLVSTTSSLAKASISIGKTVYNGINNTISNLKSDVVTNFTEMTNEATGKLKELGSNVKNEMKSLESNKSIELDVKSKNNINTSAYQIKNENANKLAEKLSIVINSHNKELITLLKYYLPLLLKATGRPINLNGKNMAEELTPYLDIIFAN